MPRPARRPGAERFPGEAGKLFGKKNDRTCRGGSGHGVSSIGKQRDIKGSRRVTYNPAGGGHNEMKRNILLLAGLSYAKVVTEKDIEMLKEC